MISKLWSRRERCLMPIIVLVLLGASFFPGDRPASSHPLPGVGNTGAAAADWMQSLAGQRRLSELSIPGSHDSGARHEPWGGTAICQTLDIASQLTAGVRFLDIRCRHLRNQFKIYHGIIDQKLSFDEVQSNCLAFLQTHPGECILMSIREEGDPAGDTRSFEDTFDAVIAGSRDKWHLKESIPTLAEARGKIVLIRRFDAQKTPEGIPATDWKWNTTFSIGGRMRVQDAYVVTNNQAKWAAIESLYQEEAAGKGRVLYLNFTSGCRPGSFGIPDIGAVSRYINPRIEVFWRTNTLSRPGVSVMDFVDARKCALIIGANR